MLKISTLFPTLLERERKKKEKEKEKEKEHAKSLVG